MLIFPLADAPHWASTYERVMARCHRNRRPLPVFERWLERILNLVQFTSKRHGHTQYTRDSVLYLFLLVTSFFPDYTRKDLHSTRTPQKAEDVPPPGETLIVWQARRDVGFGVLAVLPDVSRNGAAALATGGGLGASSHELTGSTFLHDFDCATTDSLPSSTALDPTSVHGVVIFKLPWSIHPPPSLTYRLTSDFTRDDSRVIASLLYSCAASIPGQWHGGSQLGMRMGGCGGGEGEDNSGGGGEGSGGGSGGGGPWSSSLHLPRILHLLIASRPPSPLTRIIIRLLLITASSSSSSWSWSLF
ncbi:hypothetical protein BDZ89DRAFT_1121826 [Hymenopellis radicata]|nr:hypothetical protein BDZ89DRAFT_1121826 [Hymenopellis radicata]